MQNELVAGSRYEESKTFTHEDIDAFSRLTGDNNPVHLDDEHAKSIGFKGRICHGLLIASNISKILAISFPGPGTIYLKQILDFKMPTYPGEALTYILKVVEANLEKKKYLIRTEVYYTQSSELILTGEALVLVKKNVSS